MGQKNWKNYKGGRKGKSGWRARGGRGGRGGERPVETVLVRKDSGRRGHHDCGKKEQITAKTDPRTYRRGKGEKHRSAKSFSRQGGE